MDRGLGRALAAHAQFVRPDGPPEPIAPPAPEPPPGPPRHGRGNVYAPEVMVRAETGFPGTVIRLEETSVGLNLGYRWD